MTWCWIIPLLVGAICALLGYLLGRSGKQAIINAWTKKWEDAKAETENTARQVNLLHIDLDKARESEQKANASYDELVGRFDLLQREWDKNRTAIQNLKEENNTLNIRLERLGKSNTEGSASTRQSAGDIGAGDAEMQQDSREEQIAFNAAHARDIMGKQVLENDLTIVEGIGPTIRSLFHEHGITTWYQLSQCSVEQCEKILRSVGDRFVQHHPDTWPQQARLAYQGAWEKLKTWQDVMDGGRE